MLELEIKKRLETLERHAELAVTAGSQDAVDFLCQCMNNLRAVLYDLQAVELTEELDRTA